MPVHLYFASILLTAALAAGLAAYAWRRRNVPTARIWAGLMLCACLLALTESLVMLSPTVALASFWDKLGYLFIAAIAVLWLAFALVYGGYQAWLSRRLLVVACSIPVIAQFILWSNPLHGLWAQQEVTFLQDGPFWVVQSNAFVPGLGFLMHLFYSLILIALGVVVLLLVAWQRRRTDRRQALLLAAGALIALATAAFQTFNLIPQARFRPFVPGIGVGLLLYALATFRFRLPGGAPARAIRQSVHAPEPELQRSLAMFLLVYAIIAAGITTGAYLYHLDFAHSFRSQVESQLAAIAELKVNEMAHWRAERLADAEILYRNPAFNRLARRVLEQPADMQARAELQAWLEKYDAHGQYNRIFLIDAAGVERLSALAPAEPIPAFLTQEMDALLRAEQVTFLDFHRDAADGPIHFSLLVPVHAAPDDRPLGLLVLRIDPYRYFYPYLQQWPIPSASGETLLVRREGAEVLYLNELRFQSNTALHLRFPLTSERLPAAVLGREGVMEGVDYRGVPVVAALRRVPDSPWFLVAKMDTAEVYAPLRVHARETAALFALLLALFGIALLTLWRQQRMQHYRSQLQGAQALRESEERYRLLAETTRDIILLHDMEGRISYVNQAGLDLAGFDLAEVLGKPITVLVPPDHLAAIEERFQRQATGGLSAFRYETEFVNRAGRRIPVEINSTPILRAGKPSAILIVARDITPRKQAEEALRALSARQEAILAAIPDIVMEVNRDRVYTWANQAGIAFFGEDVIGKEAAAYFVGEPDTYARVQQLFDGSTDVVYVESWQRRRDGEARLLAWWCKALKDAQGNVIGALSTARDITEQKAAEAEIQRLLAESEASRRVLLSVLEDRQRAEAQREEALARLAQERNLLRTLIDNLPDYIYVKDKEGRFLLGNLALAHSFGKATPDEVYGKSDFDFHPPELAAQYWADEQEILRSGRPLVNREEPAVEHDGQRKWVLSTKVPLSNNRGEIIGLVGIGRDITEHKRAEEALRAREAELAAVFENTPVFLALIDEERRVTKINRAGAEFAGRATDQLLGLLPGKVLRCLHVGDDSRGCGYGPHCERCVVRRSVLDTLRTGHSYFQVEADYPVRRNDRIETLRLLVSTTPVSTPAGPRVLVCLEEITAQHRTLETLRAIYDLGHKLVLSQEIEEIAQLVTDAAQGVLRFPKCEFWLADEQRRTLVAVSQTPAEPVLTVHSLPLDGERGVIAAAVRTGQTIYVPDVDQDPRYICAAEYHSRSELCVPLRVHERTIGALNSESDLLDAFRPAERELLEALANVAAVAVENARLNEETRRARELNEGIVRTALDGIVLQDAQGVVILANPAAEAMLGFAAGELRGQPWAQFVPPDQQPIAAAAVARACQGQTDRYELDLVRRDGSRLTVLVSSSPNVVEGRFAGTLMVFGDITERKQAEREIRRRSHELATLYHASQVFAQSLDPEAIGQRLVEVLEQLLGYEHGAVLVVAEATQEILPLALSDQGRGPEFLAQDKQYVRSKGLRVGQGIVGWAVQHGRPVRVGDVRQDPRYFAVREGIRSELCVPMMVGDKVIGAINVESVRPDAYDEDDERLLTALAGTAAVALQNAQLYEETRRRAAQQEALNVVIAAATAATDLPSLLETALEHTLAGLGLEMGAIWVRERPGGPIVHHVTRGLSDPAGITMAQEIIRTAHSARLPDDVSLVVNDWRQVAGPPAALAPIMARHNVAASITVHVGDPGQILGELSVAATEPRTWTAEEAALVEAVGRQLTGAIQRLRLLQQIQHQAAQMQEVLDNVPAGVLLLDPEHRIVVANPMAQEYVAALGGARVGELLERLGDQPIETFLQPSPTAAALELAIKGPPERVFTILAKPIPLERATPVAGHIIVLQDVTQDRAARQYFEMRDRLAAVGQLAAGIAHDFNNILTAIMLNNFMIRRESGLSIGGRERAKIIHEQAEQASQLISQLLDFSRRAPLEPQPLDLVPFLKEFVRLLKRTLPEHISVHLQYPRGEFLITADPARVQQVLMNLAINARDAMPTGGELTFTLDRLRVTRENRPLPDLAPGAWISIQVSDTGCGISPEILPHIFEPFFTTKKPTQGTGLGLAQVYGIVKQHGGEIDVRSVVGQGTTFTLYFPLAAATAPAAEFQVAPEPQPGSGQTILIVEDNPSLRLALAETLALLAYRTLQASSGGEALALLSNHPEIVLILSDLIMPDLGGKELLRAIRARGFDVPVIIMSGHPLGEHLEELRAYNLAGWFTKPPDLQKLTRMIGELLERRSVRES